MSVLFIYGYKNHQIVTIILSGESTTPQYQTINHFNTDIRAHVRELDPHLHD